VRVFGNEIAALMKFAVVPPIDIAARAAAHHLVRVQELLVRLQVFG
jgi:hypothetical protein